MKTICSETAPPLFSYDFPQKKEEILFLDIETTGFSPETSSLYLIGVLYYDVNKDAFMQMQWFAERHKEEKELLNSFLLLLEHYTFLYHFNGRTFDIPYILHKCKAHALNISAHNDKILSDDTGVYSIDLLQRIRKLKHFLSLEKCNQTALERFLKINRKDTFTGGELISVYAKYAQMHILEPEKAEELEHFLLLHNHEDVEFMLSLCSLLQYDTLKEDFESCLIKLDRITLSSELSVSVLLNTPLPKPVTKEKCYPESGLSPASLHLEKNKLTITLPVCQDELKYFFPDYKNYYYLPEEDIAVHKSVASFVEKSRRQKAVRKNCYIKKKGVFLPLLQSPKKTAGTRELFSKEYGDKTVYVLLPKDFETNPAFIINLIKEELPCFYTHHA